MIRLWTITIFLLCISITAIIYQNFHQISLRNPQSDSSLSFSGETQHQTEESLCNNLGGNYNQGKCSMNMFSPQNLKKTHSRLCQQLSGLWDPKKSPQCLFNLAQRNRYSYLVFNIQIRIADKRNHLALAIEINNSLESFSETLNPPNFSHLSKKIGILQTRLENLSFPPFTKSNLLKSKLNQIISEAIDLTIVLDNLNNQPPLDSHFANRINEKLKNIYEDTRSLLIDYDHLLLNFKKIITLVADLQDELVKPSQRVTEKFLSTREAFVDLINFEKADQKILNKALKPLILKIQKKINKLDKGPQNLLFINNLLGDNYQLLLNLEALSGPPQYVDQTLISTFSLINILEARIHKIEALEISQNDLKPVASNIDTDLSFLIKTLGNIYQSQPEDRILETLSQFKNIRRQFLLNSNSVMQFNKTLNLYNGSLKKLLSYTRPILNKISDFDNRMAGQYSLLESSDSKACQALGGQLQDDKSCHLNLLDQLQFITIEKTLCKAAESVELSASCPMGYRLLQCSGTKGAYIQKDERTKQYNRFRANFNRDLCTLNIKNPACVSLNKENQAKVVAHCAQWKGQFNCPSGQFWNISTNACENINNDVQVNSICNEGRVMTFGQCVNKPKRQFHIPQSLCTKDNPLGFPSRCTCRKSFTYIREKGLCLKDI